MIVALRMEEPEKLISQAQEYFTNIGFLKNGAEILKVERIEGNVLGENGRSDILFTLNKFDVDPIVRITKYPDAKWIGDFVHNYASDYEA